MKKIIFPTLTILLATLMLALLPTEAEAKIYEDTVRLHILANSDTEDDQALKLALRDEILENFASELSGFESAEGARDEILCALDEIEEFSREFIKDQGYSYDVSVSIINEWYDTREYESFTLPKGYYYSLKIVIGEGEGKNWWCVMYPPLCLDFAVSDGYTDEEEALVLGKYSVKFKLLELISEICK